MPTFLHIFEPRYRLMMRRCMEGNRRFGMLTYNKDEEPHGNLGVTQFREYGCMLEIVDFGLLPDGRSLVEARGTFRFRVMEHGVLDGYDIGRIERVDDVSLDQEKRLEAADVDRAQAYAAAYNSQNPGEAPLCAANFPALMTTAELFRYCREYVMGLRSRNDAALNRSILNSLGPCPTEPAVFPYWFASVLPVGVEEKYELLGATSVRLRLKTVCIWIRSIERGQPLYV
jgi:Lon protease-like protein